MARLTMTMRYGKGARFRGPYPPADAKPTAASGRHRTPEQSAPGTAERESAIRPPVDTERSDATPGRAGGFGGRAYALNRTYPRRHSATVPGLWPPTDAGGRNSAGQRRPCPPRAEFLGNKAPNARELGLNDATLYAEILRAEGKELPPHVVDGISGSIQDTANWPLHLKETTPLNIEAVRGLPTAHNATKDFLERALCFMTASFYDGLRASRTIKKVQLPMADIQRAVEIGKFERVPNFVDPHRGFQLAETTQPPVECRGNAPTENNDVVTTPTTHTTPGHRDESRN
ncbi:hypothetical protein LSM04_008929 [Trypanosoma melophagium]|uniref:uncharacterized protein n=1 Tax=Trypanosoma melophagium TaxID=715481 RepID=UPI00351A3905|nr:hypothetical protein LSM04_008929 [Trypanosoma melophagium]